MNVLARLYLGRYGARSSTRLVKYLSSSTLKVFPEYVDGCTLLTKGDFKNALPQFQRVLDVLDQIQTDKSSMDYFTLVEQIVKTRRYLGSEADDIASFLETYRSNVNGDAMQVKVLLLQGHNCYHHGQIPLALSHGSAAEELCTTSNEPEVNDLGKTYSLLGITHLCSGDFEKAEEYLQMAARWSESSLEKMKALNNLGLFHLSVLYDFNDNGNHHNEKDEGAIRPDILMYTVDTKKMWFDPDGIMQESSALTSFENHSECLQEALGYLNDALEEAQSGEYIIPTEEEAQPMIDLEKKVKDITFATVYVNILCNLSQVYLWMDDRDTSMDQLSSALTCLNQFNGDKRMEPLLGRVLTLTAFNNMANSQAVTAEGLFRSALDYMQGSYSTGMDTRYDYALAQGGFGILLSKWDKREKEAAGHVCIYSKNLDTLGKDNQYLQKFKTNQSIVRCLL